MLLDLLLALAIVAIIAVVAVPSLRPNDSLKLIGAATLAVSDIEYAQSQTLENPSDPTIIRVDPQGGRYWLALSSTPETPIQRPVGADAYEVTLGAGAHEHFDQMQVRLQPDADAIVFDGFGRLDGNDDVWLVFVTEAGELAVRITASTGSVAIGPPPVKN